MESDIEDTLNTLQIKTILIIKTCFVWHISVRLKLKKRGQLKGVKT